MVFLERHSSLRKVAEAVRALSPKAPYVDFRDPSTLLYAAQHGDEHTLRRRCSEGLLVDEEVDKFGLTALHYAAGRGDLQILRLLLELGAAVDTRSKDLRTPLMWAARNGHVELCSELLRHSADIHAANKLGICCLHWAAWGGSLQAVAFLLEQMADINSATRFSTFKSIDTLSSMRTSHMTHISGLPRWMQRGCLGSHSWLLGGVPMAA